MNGIDSPLSRLVCWASFVLLALLLLGRGVSRASIDPEFDQKLYFETRVSTASVEETEALVASKIRLHLVNSGLFSDVTSLSMAGRLVIRGGIEAKHISPQLSEVAEQLILPLIAPYTTTSPHLLRVSPEATVIPAAYLLYVPSSTDSPAEASSFLLSHLKNGEASLTGAGRGRIFGKAEIIIHVALDPLLCAAYGISLPDVQNVLSSWLGCAAYCGIIQGNESSIPVFISSGIDTEEQLARLPLPAGDGSPIPLKKLARISRELRYYPDRVLSPDGKRYMVSSVTPLSSGDVDSFFKVHRNPGFFPAPHLRSRIDVLKVLPFSLIPVLFLLLYGKKREMAGAMAGETLFFILILSLRGIVTPALILHLSLMLPSGPAAAFFISRGKAHFSFLLPLCSSLVASFVFPPVPSFAVLHVLASGATVLGGAVAVQFKTDGGIYYGTYLFLSCGILLLFIYINASPFLSIMKAPQWDITFYPPGSGMENNASGSFSLVSKEHHYPGHHPWLLPPETVITFSKSTPGKEDRTIFPSEGEKELLFLVPLEEGPLSTEESRAVLSRSLPFAGRTLRIGTIPPESAAGTAVYLSLNWREEIYKLPLSASPGMLKLHHLAETGKANTFSFMIRRLERER